MRCSILENKAPSRELSGLDFQGNYLMLNIILLLSYSPPSKSSTKAVIDIIYFAFVSLFIINVFFKEKNKCAYYFPREKTRVFSPRITLDSTFLNKMLDFFYEQEEIFH